ncbi:MAG: methyltransferase domain-containing protein [Acidobacteriota bacterium]
MGLTYEDARVLCDAALDGVAFDRTLTLGHQRSYLTAGDLAELSKDLGVNLPRDLLAPGAYSDSFFRDLLHTSTLDSLDASAFEGATLVHDLNAPVDVEREQSYDAVIDGGTLEHVFNFPIALANCMRMVQPGGRLFVFTNANNFLGHGFYQFSPELFYRALSADTGFEVEQMLAVEYRFIGAEFGSLRPWYRVVDPDVVRKRVLVTNAHPLGLSIRAKKVEHRTDPFDQYPQQSDYLRSWAGDDSPKEESRSALKTFARKHLPLSLRERINRVRTLWQNLHDQRTQFSLKNRDHFTPTAPRSLRDLQLPASSPGGRRKRV